MRKSLAISLIVCFLIVRALTIQAADDTKPTATPTPLIFAWKAPREFLIMDTAEVNGIKSVLVYSMQAMMPKTKDFFVLKWGELGIISLNGKAVTPRDRKRIKQIKEAYAAYPDLKISSTGKFLGVIERPITPDLATQKNNTKSLSAEVQAQAQARAILRGVMKNSWSCWAGAWVGLTLKDGESITGILKEDSPFPGGTPIDVQVTITRVGKSKDFSNGVHFRMTGIFDPDDLRQASAETALMLMDAAGENTRMKTVDEIAKKIDVSGGYSFEVVTDPKTLKPYWASQQRACLLTFGEVQESYIESHEYAFEWIGDTITTVVEQPQP